MRKIGIKCMAVMLVLAVIMSCVPIIGFAEELASGTCGDNLTWVIDDEGTLTVSGTGDMENYDEKNVAPWNLAGVEKVVIKDGVTSIGDYAFYNVSISSGIELPDSLERIGKGAFGYCYASFANIDIPSNVTSISDDAFEFLSNVKAINVAEENKNYSSADGVLFNKDKTKLMRYAPGKSDESYVIPSTVEKINSGAFLDNGNLKSIEIPNSITAIEDRTFYGCGLISVKIPNSVKSIGEMAFAKCDLTSIELSNNVEIIREGTFNGCERLTDVVIPNNIKSIGNYAFSDCSKLENIKIPENVTTIGESAFSDCKSLVNVELTNGLQEIGKNTFKACNGLKNIEIPNSVTIIGYGAFYECKNLKSVKLSDGITTIENVVFNECTQLEKIEIPNGVTLIKRYAFQDCWNLKDVTIPNSVTEIEERAFDVCENLKNIYYLGTEKEWNNICLSSNDFPEDIQIYYRTIVNILDPYKTQLSAEASKTGDTVTVTVTLNDETTINTDNIVVLAGQFSDGAFTSATELKPTAEGMKITYTGDVKSDDYSLFIWENYNGVYKPITEKI